MDTEEPLKQAKRPRNELDRIGSLNSDGTANFLAQKSNKSGSEVDLISEIPNTERALLKKQEDGDHVTSSPHRVPIKPLRRRK